MPKRRNVLIGVCGAISLAGCVGEEDEPTSEPESDPEPEPEGTEPESEEVNNETEVDEDVETEPDPNEVEPDSEPDSLSPWEKNMQTAEELFADGLRVYASQVDGPTDSILDILFSMEFGWTEVHSPMNEALEEVEGARSAVGRNHDAYDTIMEAREEVTLMDELSRYQPKHKDLYDLFVSTYDTLLDEESDWPEPELIDEYAAIESSFEEKQDEFEGLNPYFSDSELYSRKLDQLGTELDIADIVITGINYILDPGFGAQQERASLAKREFSDALDILEDGNAYPPQGTVDEDYIQIVTNWEKLAEEIERELRTI